jgi:hypothetical protein
VPEETKVATAEAEGGANSKDKEELACVMANEEVIMKSTE